MASGNAVQTIGVLTPLVSSKIGSDGLVSEAENAGWTVVETGLSTLEEWDAFESGWTKGVQTVGTDAATQFAMEREAEYQRYRGTLGFSWLLLDHGLGKPQ